MKTLITNLRGQCLFNVSMKAQPEGLISLHYGKHRKTELDTLLKGGEVKIDTEDPQDALNRILDIIRGAKIHGEVYVAYGAGGIGPLLNFAANYEGVNGIFTCFGEKVVRLPPLQLKISETRLKILEMLTHGDLNAVEIGKKVEISRAMVYKHLNGLIDMGLVKRSNSLEKYSITDAGMMIML
ncbi:ArsR family transcriptional regulator [Methanobacterium ferruginis]|uniref:ArsR family transcriptional regulator n=1 Tax=Methanobacterium ferruginis TaxID=710191 RepID=UPI00257399C3|nr:helix-turn-helix domain-containing protein [Methanobacterium ferruginis]BDZ66875.1 transcriptional regulator [Methanobacterium ferruginis]